MSQTVTTPDGTVHTFPDEATPDQIKTALAGYIRPSPGKLITTPSLPERLANRAVAQLPNIGGLLGGAGGFMLGGPFGGIAGAGIGGVAGEGARQFATAQNPSPGDVVTQGALQSAYQGLGEGIGLAAGKAAPTLMKSAVRPSKAIQKSFPDVIQTMLKEGIAASPAGAAKANTLRQSSAQALADILQQAKDAGVTFGAQDVTAPVNEVLQSQAQVLPLRTQAAVKGDLADFLTQNPGNIDPVTLKAIKREYQQAARSAYTSETGQGPRSTLFPKALAQGAQQQLETIPGVAAQEAKTQSLIGAQRAATNAALRNPHPLRFSIVEPMTYPLINSALSGKPMSNLAIKLASPEWQNLAKQSPRLFDALVRSMMANTAQQDATAQ